MQSWGEKSPSNRVGHCFSAVYIAHGMGIFVGTLTNRWNPETEFPLRYVVHKL